MNVKGFHDGIERTIDACSYKFYVVKLNKDIKCTCITHATKQANVECKYCLGTGFKIKIASARGASNEEMKGRLSIGTDATQVIRLYFTKYKYKMNELDLIIDDDSIYYAERITDMRGLQGVYTHQQTTAIKLKNDHDIRLANFYEILAKHLKKK